jgi:PKD repeat protein
VKSRIQIPRGLPMPVRRPYWLALLLAVSAGVFSAPNPANGDLSETVLSLEYNGGPILTNDPGATTNNQCPNSGATVEVFPLRTVGLSADFASKHTLKIDLGPEPSADMVLTLRTSTGAHIQSSDGGATDGAESVTVLTAAGTTSYRVIVCSFAGSTPDYHVKAELLEITTGGGDPGPCDATLFGTADPVCPGNPRFQLFVPEPRATWANAGQGGSGEFNIGFNPRTGRIMAKNGFPNARITPGEIKPGGAMDPYLFSGLPESCPELWEDKSVDSEVVGLDPILWTDQPSGRTFMSNSTAGAVGEFAFTDNDGDLWVPASASPPNGGVDHQTIGSGRIPDSLAPLRNPQNFGQYVVYCSQDLIGANCQRSLTLGATFEANAVPALGPGTSNSQGCGGLHGHLRAAPDGTMYMPDKSCGARQGGSFTLDTSTTPWTEFSIPGSAQVGSGANSDPSVAIDAANTIYFCYVNSEGGGTETHARVAVGKRSGSTITWLRDVDIGKSHGVVNAVFPEAWGGSAGRAACGFLGTNVGGSFQGTTFAGNWYAFIATTYDEGRTWATVNATPNDPVQHRAGICLMGTGCSGTTSPRNLLDFNEITVDDKGRSLYGYSDGCVSAACIAGTAGNNNTAWVRVARQIGGRSLFASQDSVSDLNDGVDKTTGPINPVIVNPKRPCLLDGNLGHPDASTRDASAVHLKWRAPDNGGSPILNYDIYRGTSSSGPYSLIGSTNDAKPLYDDLTSGDTPELFYVIKANTAAGNASANSNEIRLAIGGGGAGEKLCVAPGLTKLLDSPGTGGTAPNGNAGPGMDLGSVQLSQPFFVDGASRMVITMNTDAGVSPQPANSAWFVSMKIERGATVLYRAVRMFWGGPNPTFESYTPAISNAQTYDGRFVTAGSQKPADPLSNYVAPFNKVVIVVKTSDLGLVAGDTITGFTSAVTETTSPGPGLPAATFTVDEIPDGMAYSASGHTVVDNQFCRPNEPPAVDSFNATPNSGDSPLTVSFSGSASDPDTAPAPADTIVNYHLDFGDGDSLDSATAPTNVTHVYETDESSEDFQATLSVTDSRGAQSITNGVIRVTAINTLVPRLSAPATVAKGEPVTLDGSASSAPASETIVEYDFDFDDGTPMEIGPASSVQHVYTVGGSKAASLRIRSSSGELSSSAATAVIDVINRAPFARLTSDVSGGYAPLTVTFDGSGSSDPDTTDYVSMYDLDFGDGAKLEGQLTPFTPQQHTYTQPGYYNVLLRAYDNELLKGASDALVQIEVPNQPPVAAMTATPSTQGKNRAVTFDASASSDAEGPLLYAFDFGDGMTQSGTAASVTHAYSQAGVYTATVTVTDSSFDARSAAQSVTITNAAPVAVLTASDTQIPPYGAVNFSGAGSTDADVGDAVQTYTFTFGDGTPAVTQTRASVVHAYEVVGNYEATLVVTDKDGEASDRQVLPIKVSVGDNTQVLTGAFAPWMLGVLGGLGLLRRRRRNH